MRNLILVYGLVISGFFAYCQTPNHCLRFDGDGDRIRYLTTISNYDDWTVELWFKSENDPLICANGSPSYNHKLFSLGTAPFSIGLCGTDLFYQLGGGGAPVNFYSGVLPDWNHLAITVDGNGTTLTHNVKIYLNCVELLDLPNLASPSLPALAQIFLFGNITGILPAVTPEGWKGFIDEIRLWNGVRTLQELDENKHCPCTGNEPNIRICSPLDQGIAGQNNMNIPAPRANDLAILGGYTNGFLDNFTLNGPTSNFVLSDAPLIYPTFVNTEVIISQYFGATLIPANEICSGDPVHFCIKNLDGTPLNTISATSTISIQWQYLDNTVAQFTDVPTFTNACFGVGPGIMAIDCANNSDGYIDRKYRALIEVEDIDSGMSCIYFTEEFDMRICCPLSNLAAIEITTNQIDNLLCEGDVIDFTAQLMTPDIFVMNPGPDVSIQWYVNGIYFPTFNDLISININSYIVQNPDFCVEALVTHCAGKTETYSQCLNVDLEPQCGDIIAMMNNGLLTQVSSSPLIYNICPNSDAIIKKSVLTAFLHGVEHWQYRFPPSLTWIELGISNDQQNTNTLPVDGPPGSPYIWPAGQQCIEYQLEMTPENDPSGCPSCYSNVLTICLVEDPPSGVISGINQICSGNNTTLSVSPFNSAFTYTWYHDGLPLGNANSQNIDEGGCYWVDISNGCGLVNQTVYHCVEFCEIVPVITCPLPPNPCATPGIPITLSGCDSQDNCSGNLIYTWSWSSGTLVSQSGCTLEHIPDINGTTYTLTVTNALTGCSAQTELFIKSCA